jgi:hypothetical protein
MKIIDAHLHFVAEDEYFDGIAQIAGHENSLEHLKQEYDRLGIESGIVMGNRGLDPAHHQYPEWLHYCIGLDRSYLSTHDVKDALDHVEAHLKCSQCVGIKLYPGYNPVYVYDSVYDPVYELAEYYKKPVAIHTGATAGPNAILKYSHPLTVDEAAVHHPRVQFVMCHFGNPWLNDAAAVLEKNPNVAADLSGLLEGRVNVSEFMEEKRGYIDMFRSWLSYIDYQKLMFGTDWPLVNYDEYIDFIARLIPERYHEAVFHETAEAIYKI